MCRIKQGSMHYGDRIFWYDNMGQFTNILILSEIIVIQQPPAGFMWDWSWFMRPRNAGPKTTKPRWRAERAKPLILTSTTDVTTSPSPETLPISYLFVNFHKPSTNIYKTSSSIQESICIAINMSPARSWHSTPINVPFKALLVI